MSDESEILKAMQANAAALERLADGQKELRERLLDVEQKGAFRPSGGGGGDDSAVIMPAIESSADMRFLRSGERKTARFAFDAKALQRKTITSTISSGTIAAADRSQTIIAASERKLMVRDLLPSVPTNAGATEYVRELVATLNAGPQYDNTSPAAYSEGAVKNASDITFELVNSPVVTVAHHFTVSRQALEDSAALAQHIETRGVYGWQLELEEELLTGDGTVGTISGLVTNATAFTGGATNQTAPDTLRKAITQLALANHTATGIVLNPADLQDIELLKDTTGQYLEVVTYTNGRATVWRVKIVESNTMTAGSFLAGDFMMAARIRDRSEAHVEISLDHADYRTRNLALILIEGRVGLEIHRPAALVYGSLSYAG